MKHARFAAAGLVLACVMTFSLSAVTPTVFADCPGAQTGGCKGQVVEPVVVGPIDSLLAFIASFF